MRRKRRRIRNKLSDAPKSATRQEIDSIGRMSLFPGHFRE